MAGYRLRRLAGILAAVLLLSGCGGQEGESGREEAVMALTAEGTLKRIEYSFHSGMMYGADFDIDVTPEEVVSACYFTAPEGGWPEREERSHLPLAHGMWQELERAVDGIHALLKPVPPPREPGLMDRFMSAFSRPETIADGGDRLTFALTWEKDGTETRVTYYSPNDRRFSTLLALLKECADPVGREIVWYGEPAVTGLCFCRESKSASGHFSYQCTLKGDEEGARYYFAYFPEHGETASWSAVVYPEVWDRIAAELKRLEVEDLPRGSIKDTLYITLYYDDGQQPKVIPDAQTAEALRSFFEALTEELRQGGNG